MTRPLLPGPQPDDPAADRREKPHDREPTGQPDAAQEKQPRVATEKECLAALSKLPALLALGLLTTAQANSIRSTYTALLQHFRQQRSQPEQAGVVGDHLLDILARHPEMANEMAPILTDNQIAEIMARVKERARGTS